MPRSTRNSHDAIYFAPCLTGSSLPATSSQSDVVGTNSSTSAVSANPAQPSAEFLATVVQAVKRALPVDQAPVLQAKHPWSSSLPCAVNSSAASRSLGDVSDQALDSQASALLTAGYGFPSQSSVAQLPSSPGRTTFAVPSFVSPFAPALCCPRNHLFGGYFAGGSGYPTFF